MNLRNQQMGLVRGSVHDPVGGNPALPEQNKTLNFLPLTILYSKSGMLVHPVPLPLCLLLPPLLLPLPMPLPPLPSPEAVTPSFPVKSWLLSSCTHGGRGRVGGGGRDK